MALSPPRSRANSRRTPLSSRASAFSPERHSRPGLTEAEIHELKAAFDLVDADCSGMIEPRDLKEALVNLGFEPKNSTVYQMFADVDVDCSGNIDFEEFLTIATEERQQKDKRTDVDKLFRLFDDDRTGFVTIENLRRIARELGENVNDDDLREMIARADTTGTGRVNMDDFYNIMTK